jgi:ribose 5-phosphate isomerase B
MKIGIGCDPNAAALKTMLIKLCESLGHEVTDLGSDDPIYANTAIAVAESVAAGKFDRGILICGTGLGMSIAANKVKGAYAALLSDVYSAKRAILSNDSNIACLGAFTIGEKLACDLVEVWLSCDFVNGCASQSKVDRYKSYDAGR